jgi:hypothetical protein
VLEEGGTAGKNGPTQIAKTWNCVIFQFRFNNLPLRLNNGVITFTQGGLYYVRAVIPQYRPSYFKGRLYSKTRQATVIIGSGGWSREGSAYGNQDSGFTIGYSEIIGVIVAFPKNLCFSCTLTNLT